MNNYLWAFDISLSNTGCAVFRNGLLLDFFSVKTTQSKDIPYRLNEIADFLVRKKDYYSYYKNNNILAIERGFTRFNTATQHVYRATGLINYLFYDSPQIYYSPMTIKKVVGGSGKCSKKELQEKILKIYPNLKFNNEDESDAVAVGLCYFMSEK